MDAIVAGGRGGDGYADYVYVPGGYDDDSRDVSKFTSLQYVRSYVLRTTRYNVP